MIHAPISVAGFQYSFAIASIIAPAFFATLYELDHAAPWLALALINGASIGGMLLLERALPAAALRDPAEARRAR